MCIRDRYPIERLQALAVRQRKIDQDGIHRAFRQFFYARLESVRPVERDSVRRPFAERLLDQLGIIFVVLDEQHMHVSPLQRRDSRDQRPIEFELFHDREEPAEGDRLSNVRAGALFK